MEELIKVRRTLHQHPEIGYQEYKTAKLIGEKLQALGIHYRWQPMLQSFSLPISNLTFEFL